MHYISSLYCVTTPLHVSGPFVAPHQEAECIVWQMLLVLLLSRLSAGLAHPGPPTVDLEVKRVTFATLYTRPTKDGLQRGPKPVEVW
jgi:hypothetical protein